MVAVRVLLFAALASALLVPVTGAAGPDPARSVGGLEREAGDVPLFDGVFDELTLETGLVVGAGLAIVAAIASLFFLGGTKFVNSENVLDNDARRTIFEYITQNPGAHLRATAAALDLSTTNVLWHLRKLEDANLVSSRKFDGYKLFYPVAGGVESRRRAIAASVLKNENARRILEYVSGNPSAHQREIARSLGVNHGTIRWHLRKLGEAALLLQMKRENGSQYYVTDLGNELLGKPTSGVPAPAGAMPPFPTAAPAAAGTAVLAQPPPTLKPPAQAPSDDDDPA